MESALLSLLASGPATMLVVATLLVILHKAGVLEVLLSFVGKKSNGVEKKMDELKAYYNHETTELLSEIKEELQKLNQKHDNYEIIGIKTRGCTKPQ